MREIVLDTESTGLDPDSGHRLVEIGCVEIINLVPTGKTFWTYLNPERDIPEEARRVHGITEEFVADKPLFIDQAQAFLDFIGDAPLVIHNAAFDMKFINAELRRIKYQPLPFERAIDTVAIARKKFPGSPANLDALCRRFEIDNSSREYHGALLDAQLLAEVYLELSGGRQPDLGAAFSSPLAGGAANSGQVVDISQRVFRTSRAQTPSAEELSAHKEFMAKFKTALWREFDVADDEQSDKANEKPAQAIA